MTEKAEEVLKTTIITMVCGFGLVLIILGWMLTDTWARDLDGRYANSPLKPWFDQLSNSKKELCCSFADGRVVDDPDWETVSGHYRVRIDGEWLTVPDEAVITEPNRAGRTMVWPIKGYLGTTIRCFLPGALT